MLALPRITHDTNGLRRLPVRLSRRHPSAVASVTPSLSLEFGMAGQGLGFYGVMDVEGDEGGKRESGFWGREGPSK